MPSNNILNIKAKIVDMQYKREQNLFRLVILDVENNKQTSLAIKGTDWGITQDFPDEVIDAFIKNMVGKEKNLTVEIDKSSIKDVPKDEEGFLGQKEMENLHSNYDKYPFKEVKEIWKEENQSED